MSNWSGTTTTFVDANALPASDLNTYTQTPLLAVGDDWTSDTSWGWHGAVSDPAIGNGTKAGRYKTIGKTTYFALSITMGSTTTFGSGLWDVGIPGGGTSGAIIQSVAATAYDTSGAAYWCGTGYIAASAGAIGHIASPTGTPFASGTPFTWASGDVLSISGVIWTA